MKEEHVCVCVRVVKHKDLHFLLLPNEEEEEKSSWDWLWS